MNTTPYQTIGHNIPRKGATDKVLGTAKFSADILLADCLTLKVLRSGHHHAEISHINTAEARNIDGVVGVFTAADIPGKNLLGIINKDQPLLASDRVRSTADPVALVVAETDMAADKALAAIEITYNDLPAIFDPELAVKADAPQVHTTGNILSTRVVRRGNTEAAFADCFNIIERTYRTNMVEHTYLEPDAGIGFIDSDGTLVIYASTQNPHYDHQEVVSLLDIPEKQVRIIQAATGGGFGSKLDLNVQGFIGLALYHLRRPIRCVYSREEAYLATSKRHPLIMRIKTGTDRNGYLQAIEARILCDTGAYGSYGIAVASRSAIHVSGPYEIPHVNVESSCVYTNNPFCGAMRGFGAPQAAFAHESQLDLHALELNLDPLEIRERNMFRVGSHTVTGQELKASAGIGECFNALRPHYIEAQKSWLKQEKSTFRKRGIGIGAMWYGIGNTGAKNPSTARVEMTPKGQVTLFTGCADIGQGSTTILSQIVAEILGLNPAAIHTVVADTGQTSNAGATSASRQTYISGNAVYQATEKLAQDLITETANQLHSTEEDMIFDSGHVCSKSDPNRRLSFAALATAIHSRKGSLSWHGYFDPDTIPLDPDTGQGVPYSTYAFACHMAYVVVDTLTGEVTVEKIVAAHDVGKALHPENVKGQICGGIAMGVGFALMEEYVPGVTDSMKDYHIPTFADMPQILPIIIESSEPTGPFGAKGVGEPALIPTSPAILNGIANALNRRIYQLPASLEKVLETSVKAGHFEQVMDVTEP